MHVIKLPKVANFPKPHISQHCFNSREIIIAYVGSFFSFFSNHAYQSACSMNMWCTCPWHMMCAMHLNAFLFHAGRETYAYLRQYKYTTSILEHKRTSCSLHAYRNVKALFYNSAKHRLSKISNALPYPKMSVQS